MTQIRGEWEFSECLGYSGDHTPSISVFCFLHLCLPHGLGACWPHSLQGVEEWALPPTSISQGRHAGIWKHPTWWTCSQLPAAPPEVQTSPRALKATDRLQSSWMVTEAFAAHLTSPLGGWSVRWGTFSRITEPVISREMFLCVISSVSHFRKKNWIQSLWPSCLSLTMSVLKSIAHCQF